MARFLKALILLPVAIVIVLLAVAGVIAPTVTGFVYKFTGSFQIALLIAGLGILMSALSVLFIVPKVEPIDLRDDPLEGPAYARSRS